jgi:hypothetical protein
VPLPPTKVPHDGGNGVHAIYLQKFKNQNQNQNQSLIGYKAMIA